MNIKYLYVRNPERNRDVTIVSDLFEKDGKKYVKCAWAFRSNKDQFIKREGRNCALDRLQNDDPKYTSVFEIAPENVNFNYIASEVINQIVGSENTPEKFIQDLLEDMYFFSFLYTKKGSFGNLDDVITRFERTNIAY